MTSEQTHIDSRWGSLSPQEKLNAAESEALQVKAGLEAWDESPWEERHEP